jgi:hypothetical protein
MYRNKGARWSLVEAQAEVADSIPDEAIEFFN